MIATNTKTMETNMKSEFLGRVASNRSIVYFGCTMIAIALFVISSPEALAVTSMNPY